MKLKPVAVLSQSFFHQGTILTTPERENVEISFMSQSFFHQGTILTETDFPQELYDYDTVAILFSSRNNSNEDGAKVFEDIFDVLAHVAILFSSRNNSNGNVGNKEIKMALRRRRNPFFIKEQF